jgi:hypothetical protein
MATAQNQSARTSFAFHGRCGGTLNGRAAEQQVEDRWKSGLCSLPITPSPLSYILAVATA